MPDTSIEKLLSKFAVGTVLVFIGNLAALGVQYGLRVIIGRHLTPSDYGLIVLGLTMMNIVSLFVLIGLNRGVSQRIPRVENPGLIYRLAICTSVIVAILGSLFVILWRDQLARIVGDPQFGSIMIPFTLAIPFLVVFRMSLGGARGTEDGKAQLFIQLSYVIVAGLVISAIIIGLGAFQIALAWSFGVMISAIVGLGIVYWRTSLLKGPIFESSRSQFENVRESFLPLLWLSLPLMLSSGVSKLLQQSDNFFITYFVDSFAVGLYDAAFTSAIVILLFTRTTGFLFLPMFSKLHEQNHQERMNKMYKMATKGMAFVALPAFLIIVFHASELLNLLYGTDYTIAAGVAAVVAAGLFSHVMFGPNQAGLVAVGDTKRVLISNVAALVTNIGLNIILIPEFGIMGAAMASALSYAARNVYLSFSLYRHTGVQPFYTTYLLPLGISSLLFLGINYIYEIVGGASLLYLAGFLCVYFVVHAVLIYSFGLEDLERSKIEVLVGRLREVSV